MFVVDWLLIVDCDWKHFFYLTLDPVIRTSSLPERQLNTGSEMSKSRPTTTNPNQKTQVPPWYYRHCRHRYFWCYNPRYSNHQLTGTYNPVRKSSSAFALTKFASLTNFWTNMSKSELRLWCAFWLVDSRWFTLWCGMNGKTHPRLLFTDGFLLLQTRQNDCHFP